MSGNEQPDELAELRIRLRAADELADAVAVLVQLGRLDSRSRAADALLDYRNPPRTERTDRITELQRQTEVLESALKEQDERIAEQERAIKWMKQYVEDTSEGFEHIETCDSYGCDCEGGCPVSDIPSAFRILRERLKERDATIAELTSQLGNWKLAAVLAGASGKSKQVVALKAKIALLEAALVAEREK